MNADMLLEGGRIVDVALVVVAIEFALLWLYRARTGRGPILTSVLPNLLAGGCLMLALRAALAGDAGVVVLAWLLASLPCHLLDLRKRWLS